jgi:hypothetical protein
MTELRNHPIVPIMARLAEDAGRRDELVNADIQQRAVVSLLTEILDMFAPQVLPLPRLLPFVTLTLRAYAELIERSAELLKTDPDLANLAESIKRNGGPR